MDPEDLKEIFPIFCGNEEHFSHLSCYLSKIFATDKLADPNEIDWLLKKRDLVYTQKLQDIRAVQAHVNILKARYFSEEMGINKKKAFAREIEQLEEKLNKARFDTVHVAEINCYDVLPLLGIQWLNSAKRNCKTYLIWKVVYENRDPDRQANETFGRHRREQ